MSTRREFLQKTIAVSLAGSLDPFPGLNGKEKSSCPGVDEPVGDARFREIRKSFRFPVAHVHLGLTQLNFVSGPGHRYYTSITDLPHGKVTEGILCDLDMKPLPEMGYNWHVKFDSDGQPAKEEIIPQRIRATEHLEDMLGWTVIRGYPEELWGDKVGPLLEELQCFIHLLTNIIQELSPIDRIREETWMCSRRAVDVFAKSLDPLV